MRDLPPGLASHLASGATTLCWCWRLTRRDGTAMGFTDHDRDLTFAGTTFEANAGFTASEIRESVGLGVDNLEVESALSSSRLEEADILAGLYDDARVEIWRVNWQAPEQHVLVRSGSLGDVRRSGAAFTAEVRGLSHYLQQPTGRLFQYACDADVGDHRCRIALSSSTLSGSAEIGAIRTQRSFTTTDLTHFAADWFSRGLLTFTSGANAGRSFEVKRHIGNDAVSTIELWQEPLADLQIGDTFTVTAGCDKQLSTCASKFSNTANFRGFPHMPGNDFVTSVARPGRLPSARGG
jgi:uncharacterized phage protein (TIGR02218 family)